MRGVEATSINSAFSEYMTSYSEHARVSSISAGHGLIRIMQERVGTSRPYLISLENEMVTESLAGRRVLTLWSISKCRQTKTSSSLLDFTGRLRQNIPDLEII